MFSHGSIGLKYITRMRLGLCHPYNTNLSIVFSIHLTQNAFVVLILSQLTIKFFHCPNFSNIKKNNFLGREIFNNTLFTEHLFDKILNWIAKFLRTPFSTEHLRWLLLWHEKQSSGFPTEHLRWLLLWHEK